MSRFVNSRQLKETVDLAWPRVVTGFMRTFQQAADVAMVGIALGPAAIAGIAFAFTYWKVANRFALGLAGGTISMVSQAFGADNRTEGDRAVKQSVVLAIAVATPIAVLFVGGREQLVGVFTDDARTIGFGAAYLAVLGPAVVFEFVNKVASRTFAGVSDTITPMFIRAGGAGVNVVLNAVLIFVFDLGVVGAALGTLAATVLTTGVFLWGLVSGSYGSLVNVPIGLGVRRPFLDWPKLRRLVDLSLPLMVRRTAEALFLFPLLAIAGIFGPVTVAALEVGRRVGNLANSLNWGFSIAASTLVGQRLGEGDTTGARQYGNTIIGMAFVLYVLLSTAIFLLAKQVAGLFVSDAATIAAAVLFIQAISIAAVGRSVERSATGVLRGAGDTRWPFYATLVGLYFAAVPVAYLGVELGFGVNALAAAMLFETYVPAALALYRFRGSGWYGTVTAGSPAD
jgi:putative MATE family efflux protein